MFDYFAGIFVTVVVLCGVAFYFVNQVIKNVSVLMGI